MLSVNDDVLPLSLPFPSCSILLQIPMQSAQILTPLGPHSIVPASRSERPQKEQ